MALIIGVSLGLIGGGGSILAVPVLAYLFLLDEKVATTYSLFIVGIGALVGGLKQYQNKQVDLFFLSFFTSITQIGIFIGAYVGQSIDGQKLEKGFSYFIIVMAVFMFFMEFIVE